MGFIWNLYLSSIHSSQSDSYITDLWSSISLISETGSLKKTNSGVGSESRFYFIYHYFFLKGHISHMCLQ